jgi:mannose-1-phosphate guanylyltransferase
MKAFLLAAGLGTRLRPLTDSVTKCLVPIGGRPLLAYSFDLLAQHGIDEVLINTHHLPEQVEAYVRGLSLPFEVMLTFESELLGSAGTVRQNWDFVAGEPEFFILYADNLTNVNLTHLLGEHRRCGQAATIGLFHAERPWECGIVRLSPEGTVLEFQEKAPHPASDLAFGGVMVTGPDLHDLLPWEVPRDIGHDVLGKLVGNMAGVELRGYLRDIGTMESYQRAQQELHLVNERRP